MLPGDVISTGTPSGVGLGFDPPVFLRNGDIVELGIDGLGVSTQKALDYADRYFFEFIAGLSCQNQSG